MSQKAQLAPQSQLKAYKVLSHAFSPDLSQIAVSLRDCNSVVIFNVGETPMVMNSWEVAHTLSDQSQPISTLDWSKQNMILTGSYDKSVLVYRFNNGKWEKDLTIEKNTRAILTGCWAPNGNKFALGTGCCQALVGYFDVKSQWWQTIRVHKTSSSVLSVAWHPSGRVLAVGSADFSVTIVTAFVEESLEDSGFEGSFNKIKSQSESIFKYKADNWVNALAFSPTGTRFAFSLHSGLVSYVDITRVNGDKDKLDFDLEKNSTILNTLPINQFRFFNDNSLIAVGYDRKPFVIKIDEEGVKFDRLIDNLMGGTQKSNKSMIQQRVGAFQQKQSVIKQQVEPSYMHQTPITCLKIQNDRFTTSDTNGTVNIWSLQ